VLPLGWSLTYALRPQGDQARRGVRFTANGMPFVPCLVFHQLAETLDQWQAVLMFRDEGDYASAKWVTR
jgi:hypothetical protein